MRIPVEWIFWIAGAGIIMFALWLLYAALWKDRSRGRRRCPKCWYDMSGTPGPKHLTCSECGRTFKRERQLRRTRRKYFLALASVVVFKLGVGAAIFPSILNKTWPRLIPSDALILAMPKLEQTIPILSTELDRRIAAGTLSKRQWRWLITRTIPMSVSLPKVNVRSRDVWPRDSQPRFTGRALRLWSGKTWFNALPMIVEIRSRAPNGEALQAVCDRPMECTMHRNNASLQPWFVQSGALGEVSVDSNAVTFDIAVRVQVLASQKQQWLEIATNVAELPLRMQGQLSDFLEPYRSPEFDRWLGQNLTCAATTRGIWIKVLGSAQCPLKDPMTVAGQAELVGDGRVVASADVIETVPFVRKWIENPGTMTMLGGIWEQFEKPTQAMLAREWSLRLRSDVQVALDDFASKRYWVGEVVLPLEYDEKRREWRTKSDR